MGSSCLVLAHGNEARERGSKRMGFHPPCNQQTKCQSSNQVESPIPELISVSGQGQREGTTGGGPMREAHPVGVGLPPGFRHQNVRWVKRKRERAGQSGKKGKFIRGNGEGDRPLRRACVLPFWRGLSYTPPLKNSLKRRLIFSL